MPVFNAERYLATALKSVLTQTFTDFEVVIVDDGSTDASPAILASHADQDPRVRILRQDKAGIVTALNRGLNECRAPLVARMDADDVAYPERLGRQVAFMRSHPSVAAMGSSLRLITPDGRPGPTLRQPTAPSQIKRLLRRGNVLAHPSVILRKDAILACKGYREPLRHAEDYDLWMRLSESYELANVDDCLLDYRVHPQQVSWSHAEAQAIRILGVQLLARQRAKGGADAVDRGLRVDADFLLNNGLERRDIEEALVTAVAGRVALCNSVGMRSEAALVRSELLERVAKTDLKNVARTALAWADFVSSRRNRHWPAAGVALLQCAFNCILDPASMRIACRTLLGDRAA
jgi:hypothetical protein